ncbi:hypothetical protein I316_02353 [Kwoniella heveanensis BCC8398]|uniref:Uncharacterized protein n=1 Tax=Kwoniella heveanensis BCC8398 TaxID=1296120 RepID=A0A1B9GXZ0_9TREE|nr:hypothetical protein I316_02353 [Kwoniella heveanensis BCC8398]
MANSPPLSLIYLAPLPDPKRHLRRPGSVTSATSATPTWSSVISQPPSSYNRRSRSVELHKALSLLAPASEKAEFSWVEPFGTAGSSKVLVGSGSDIFSSNHTISMTTASPNPPKKPGFFRRLSLSTSQSQPQARVQPSVNGAGPGSGSKHLARNGNRNDNLAGPSYESIPAGAAPSAFANTNGRMGSNGPVVFPNKKVSERPLQRPSSPPQPRNSAPTRPENRPPPLYQPPRPELIPPSRASPNTARPVPTPLAIPADPLKPNNMRSVSQPNPARYSRFEDADGPSERPPLPPGAQPSMVSNLKQAEPRGVVSARRSTSSSRRSPIAKVEKALGSDQKGHPGVRRVATTTAAASPTSPSKSPTVSPTAATKEPKKSETAQLSEASAYAKAVAATLSGGRPPHASPPRTEAKLSPVSPPVQPKTARPLPNPPSGPSRSASGAQFVVIASSPKSPPKQDKPTTVEIGEKQSPSPNKTPKPHLQIDHRASKRVSSQPLSFDFPRSPTLPPLIDPRTAKDNRSDPIAQWSHTGSPSTLSPRSPPLASSQLPPRLSSAQSTRRVVSSPLASPSITSNGWKSPTPSAGPPQPVMERRHPTRYLRNRSRASLTYILSYTRIQATLLPYLSINSFLSLTGASDVIRKRFTGETVGRWVMKEWGIQVDREKGRSWPNLTVWEGFLESLLHDPVTYSTYSPQWYGLLQHLCLSHSLIVLHLRQLPTIAFPSPPPLPFEDDFVISAPSLPFSNSVNSFGSQRPRSRLGSAAGSDAGSITPSTKMPRQERLIEIVMPEPLAPQSAKSDGPQSFPINHKARRRGSIGSLASATSLHFGRRRSASITTESNVELSSNTTAAPMASGKAALPPVSYPSAKRYGFKRHGEPTRSRTSSESGRPGSIFSVQSSPSLSSAYQRGSGMFNGRGSFAVDRNAPPVPGFPAGLPMPPPIGGGPRSSFASSDAGRSSRRSDHGGGFSPINGTGFSRRDLRTPPPSRPEPSFDRPIPLTLGRAPILRVFVPLSETVRRWPSAEGAAAAVKELEKCGALRRMQAGDLVVNTAIRAPKTTEHVLVFAPNVRHLLIPLDYSFSPTGHLPIYINGLDLPPSYYYPFLPTPQVLYLDLAPFGQQALQSLRLAYDRRDVTVASGARLSAKRYLHVAGFEIKPTDKVAQEWCGTVSLEAEGTAEGKADLEQRLVGSQGTRPLVGPWELIREKSMTGTIWLRLLKEKDPRGEQ